LKNVNKLGTSVEGDVFDRVECEDVEVLTEVSTVTYIEEVDYFN